MLSTNIYQLNRLDKQENVLFENIYLNYLFFHFTLQYGKLKI